MMPIQAVINGALLSIILLAGCSGEADTIKELTVYVSADEYVAREVFAAFTASTDIEVVWVGDTEASKTTALVNRLQREKDNPFADVFWSSEILGTIQLANDGILMPHHSAVADTWPAAFRDSQFRWFGFSPRARVIAYDPSRIDESTLPRMWWEYGEAAMADPRFGTTGTHLAVMASFTDRFSTFLESVQGKPLLGGNAATAQAVVNGTAKYAMTDSDDVHALKERGASIAMFYPRHRDGEGGGTLLIPNTVGMIRGCDHPELAAIFVDFLLSDQVAVLLANSSSHNIPIQPSLADQFPELVVEDPLVVDFYAAAQMRGAIMPTIMDALRSDGKK